MDRIAGLRHLMIVPVLTLAVAARGVPFPRAVLLAGTGFQIVAGLALVLGFCVAWAALGLILFTVVASVLLVNFRDKEGEERIALRSHRRPDACRSSWASAMNPDPEWIPDLEAGVERRRELAA
jgi:hypothetical protein